MSKTNRLTKISVKEISLVANPKLDPGTGTLIFKRDSVNYRFDLLRRIQDGIDNLKKSNLADYGLWKLAPKRFNYEFSGPGQFGGTLTITKKESTTILPQGKETPTHRQIILPTGQVVWKPKTGG